MKPFKLIRTTFALLAGTLLFACTNPDEIAIPSDILSVEKMAEVMVDVHLLEATMNLNAGITNQSVPDNVDVFKSHDVTQQQYEDSFLFYTENPELLGEVYQIVLDELSKKQAEVMQVK